MPNGWDDTLERFRELEEPLRSRDPSFEHFAKRLGVDLGRNYHEHPERRITLRDGDIIRAVCVSVVTGGEGFRPGPNGAAYILSGFAWQDIPGGRRLWSNQFFYWSIMPAEAELEAALDSAWASTRRVAPDDMSFFPSYGSDARSSSDNVV